MNDRPANLSPSPRAISRPTLGGLSLLLIVALAFGTSARTGQVALAASALDGFGERAISPSVPTAAARPARRSAPDKPLAIAQDRARRASINVDSIPPASREFAHHPALDRLGAFVLDLPPPPEVLFPDETGIVLLIPPGEGGLLCLVRDASR